MPIGLKRLSPPRHRKNTEPENEPSPTPTTHTPHSPGYTQTSSDLQPHNIEGQYDPKPQQEPINNLPTPTNIHKTSNSPGTNVQVSSANSTGPTHTSQNQIKIQSPKTATTQNKMLQLASTFRDNFSQQLVNNPSPTDSQSSIAVVTVSEEVNSPVKKKKRKLRIGVGPIDMEIATTGAIKRNRDEEETSDGDSPKKQKTVPVTILENVQNEAAGADVQPRCKK